MDARPCRAPKPTHARRPAVAELARCLLIGCGCRGLALAARLIDAGHVVRGTSRSESRRFELEAAGVEPFLADPDRVATLVPALAHVTVVCVLLGSAAGERARLAALHGTRLEMLLHKLIDTTVRGVVYETVGTVDRRLLKAGAATVDAAAKRSAIGFALIEVDPADHERWLVDALSAVERVLG